MICSCVCHGWHTWLLVSTQLAHATFAACFHEIQKNTQKTEPTNVIRDGSNEHRISWSNAAAKTTSNNNPQLHFNYFLFVGSSLHASFVDLSSHTYTHSVARCCFMKPKSWTAVKYGLCTTVRSTWIERMWLQLIWSDTYELVCVCVYAYI